MMVRLKEEFAAKLAKAMDRLENRCSEIQQQLTEFKLRAELVDGKIRIPIGDLLAEAGRQYQETCFKLAELFPPEQDELTLSAGDVIVVG